MNSITVLRITTCVGLLAALGCSSSDDAEGEDDANNSTGGSNAGSTGGSGGSNATGGSTSSGSGGSSGDNGDSTSTGGNTSGPSNTTTTTSGGPPILPMVPGDPDPDAPETALPELPALVNVEANATHDSVFISFDPIDGAVDYRVYPLPADADISVDDAGHVTVKDAIYRCAGNRQAAPTNYDETQVHHNGAITTLVDNQDIDGHTRSLDDARLGYVYATPGENRVPVYALGAWDHNADNYICQFGRWGTSRDKHYVTSPEARAALLSMGARDDGIVFYAPAEGVDGTQQVLTSFRDDLNSRYYFVDGTEDRDSPETAFRVLEEQAEGSVPLMRVFTRNMCGNSHDELAPGMTRFERARYQGSKTPMWEMHWSGITEKTILVVEALAEGCPDLLPGVLGPESRDAYTAQYSSWTIDYRPWVSLEDAKSYSDAGEVFVNGQHSTDSKPLPIARSFVEVEPGPKPDLDWFMGFGPDEDLGTFEETDCGRREGSCSEDERMVSDAADVHFGYVTANRYAFGKMLGELWVTYADTAADTNGKFRFTPTTHAEVSSDSYLYVTMTVDAMTTARRYPQFLISDQEAPVQHNMDLGNTIVVQTFSNWPPLYQVEVCDHRLWDVNFQCPHAKPEVYYEPDDPDFIARVYPHPDLGDRIGVDRPTRFEAYVSTERAYLFLDGDPYGCVDLPDAGVPSGQVTVTFGDVLYHSGVDELEFFDYYQERYRMETRRHFDNLGFKSGVAAPAWDASRFPCTDTFHD